MRYGDPRPVRHEVIACFEKSVRIVHRVETAIAATTDQSNLAAFHIELGRFEIGAAQDASFGRAETLLREALEAFRDCPEKTTLEVLLNFAVLHMARNNLPLAIEWFSRTCTEARRQGRTLSMPYLAALSQMGKALSDLGELKAAEFCAKGSHRNSRQTGGALPGARDKAQNSRALWRVTPPPGTHRGGP